MRLLITLDFPPERGGIQRHLFGIVAHTFTKDDSVIVGCRQSGRATLLCCTFACRVTYVSTALSRLNKKWSLVPLFFHCLRMRRRQGASLSVECGNVYAGVAAWIVSLIMPLHYRVYAHGTELIGLRKATLTGVLLRQVLKRSDGIIANSSYTASQARALCPGVHVEIIFPRIELPSKSAPLSRNATDKAGVLNILCVGRLVPHKGHDVLLAAVSRLPADRTWSLVIAGDGFMLARLMKQCTTYGIGGRVRFETGLTDKELSREYCSASLFVLPSVPVRGTEGFGIVLLEAMAARLPIVASDVGGVAEVLDNGSCGVLVEPGDPACLHDAIVRVAGDAVLQGALVSAAWERMQKHYVWQ
jgi:phosphatidylinositol alpha-1,6-mannosyltransferase